MAASYKPLFKMLIDRNMKKKELAALSWGKPCNDYQNGQGRFISQFGGANSNMRSTALRIG